MRMIDSGVLYALFKESDEFHSRAVELVKECSGESFLCPVTVLQEVVELLRRTNGAEAACIALTKISHSGQIMLAFPEVEELDASVQVMRKFKQMSFCDALTVSIAAARGVKQVVSFDRDFDSVKGLKRVH